jgi:hypothetical protein
LDSLPFFKKSVYLEKEFMSNIELYTEISKLPASLRQEVMDFIEFLNSKRKAKPKIREREFGCSKGLFTMHSDFDEPLDDFKEYM